MKFFVHIGFNKTASTYLQEKFFNRFNDYNFLGKPVSNQIEYLVKEIICNSDDEFIKNEKKFLNIINSEIAKKKTDKIILSHEGLLLTIRHNTKNEPNRNNIFSTIKRVNKLLSYFGEVKFLFIIRKYDEMLESSFFQHIEKFEFKFTHREFEEILMGKSKKNAFVLENYFYGKLFKFFKNNSMQVDLIVYEDFLHDKETFFKQLLDFLEIKKKINYLEFDDVRIRFRHKKDNFLNKILSLIPTYKNLMKYLFNYKKYIAKITYAKKLFKLRKLKYLDTSKFKKEIYKFYESDFEELPLDIKKKCLKYGYFGKNHSNNHH